MLVTADTTTGYTIENYSALLTALSYIEGKFLLRSYPSSPLTEYTFKHGWHSKSFKFKVSVSTHEIQKEKTEVVTANYELQKQYDLVDLMQFSE